MNDKSRRRAGLSSSSPRADLFTAPNGLPKGFCYRPNILSGGEEDGLVREVADLPFKPFDFHGYYRQVVSFGYRFGLRPRCCR
jgi:hypothetical protein